MRTLRLTLGWIVVCVLAPALGMAQAIQGYTINTFAGTGTNGFAGDSGPANAANFNLPCGLAFDSSGNLFVGDSFNSRVRKIDTSGNVSTVAGNGTKGYFGDTGAATSGGISYPCNLAVDKSNNLYIADAPNHAVRKVSSSGTLTTFAAGHEPGFAGDGGNAVDARVNYAGGVAVDNAGSVYISDTNSNRIRKVTTDGIINTFAGTDGTGLVGDGGPALSAHFDNPLALAVDAAGNLYVADTYNHAIRRITLDGTITTVAGNGSLGFSGDGGLATKAQLNYPKGVAIGADGVIYIADTFNDRIRAVAPNGTISTIGGGGYFGDAGDGGPALQAILKFPAGIAVDGAGNVYIADTQNNKIKILTPNPRPPAPGAPPSITPGGVVTALSFGGSATVAPGSWIEIYGTNFATTTRSWAAAEFNGVNAPTALEGTRVAIGGQLAYVAFISPGQINAQVPSNVGTGPQPLTVSTLGGTSAQFTVNVAPTQAGVLAPGGLRIGGRQYAAALLPDGTTYVLPPAAIPATPSRPAHPGETVVMFGVGFGPVDTGTNAGQVVQQSNSIVTPLSVLFGQTPAAVSYAGLAPGAIGLYQINVAVPAVPDNDAVPLTFTLGGVTLPQTLVTAVRR